MKKRARIFQDFLKKNDLEFIKLNIKSATELLLVAKEVVKGGRLRLVKYNENTFVYDERQTKLGELRTDLKNGNTKVISQLYAELKRGIYPNKPFQGMLVERLDKPDKPRLIKIPAVTDRIVYSLILDRIWPFVADDVKKYPIFGLKKKGVAAAMKRLSSIVTDRSVVLKLDFQSYFDTIPREMLIEKIKKYKIGNEEIEVIKAAINAPTDIPKKPIELVARHGHKFRPYETKIGLPQGCAFSPLLASIYALDVESYLMERNISSIRYIDDIIIFTKSSQQARKIFKDLNLICTKLGLLLHEPIEKIVCDKSYIAKANQPIRFLGLDVQNKIVMLPNDKIVRFKKVLTERLSDKLIMRKDIDYRNGCISSFIIGWTRYYRQHSHDWSKHKAQILDSSIEIVNNSHVDDSCKNIIIRTLKKEFTK